VLTYETKCSKLISVAGEDALNGWQQRLPSLDAQALQTTHDKDAFNTGRDLQALRLMRPCIIQNRGINLCW